MTNSKEHCWNNRKPHLPGYWAQDGWIHDGPGGMAGSHPRWVWLANAMTKECQQPGKGFPPLDGCVGCRHLGESE